MPAKPLAFRLWAPTLGVLALSPAALAHDVDAAAGAPQQSVLQREDLSNGTEMIATKLHVPPGSVSPAHRHAGTLFVYMLSGHVRSQLNDGKTVLFGPGESWTEPAGTHHTHFENPSQSEPAELLVVFIAPENATLTTMDQ